MSVQPIDDPYAGHEGPWTEDDWLALPESRHVELLDGSLLVSPFAGIPHQRVVRNVARALERAAPPGFEVLESLNVRVMPGTILIPDVVVLAVEGLDGVVADTAEVGLAVEVTSPSNAWVDRRVKREAYAAGGVPHLRVELHRGSEPISATAYGPGPRGYEEVARSSGLLVLTTPFPVQLDLPPLVRAIR